MSAPRVVIGCVKWGHRYGPDYVNVLYRAALRWMSYPHRFVCITNEPEGLDSGIEVIPFPEFRVPRSEWGKSNLPKIAMLAPGVLDDDEIVLQIDLDVMILGELAPFVDLYRERPAFYSLREWNPALVRALVPPALRPDRGTQGSVYLYRAGDQRSMFEKFDANTEWVLATYRTDRFYFPKAAQSPAYLPYEWCLSFKNACLWYWPLNLLFPNPKPPQGVRILAFHGEPRPIDLLGPAGKRWGTRRKFGDRPVPWVVDYWRSYGGTLPG